MVHEPHRSLRADGTLRAPYRRAGRRARAVALVLLAMIVAQLTEMDASMASFLSALTAGTQALTAATLATPTGLGTANGGCAGAIGQTNVAVSWTGSALLDANGSFLIGGYTVLRSTTSGGVYASVGTVTGSPPASAFTDVGPSGASVPQVFVGNGGATKTMHAVNSSTNAGTSITTGTIGSEPNSVAVTPDGASVVVAEGASSQVQIVTVSSDTVARTIAIPKTVSTARPDAVAITPNGLTAYVVDGANKLVYPLTISTGALGTAIAVGTQGDPGAIVVTPDGTKVYVANFSSHSVSVIATASNTVTATVTVGAGVTGAPIALAVTPSSAHVYVADQGNGQVDDITTASNTVTATITVGSMVDANVAGGGDPNILAVAPGGAKVYVATYAAGTVADISTATDTVTKTITLLGTTPNPNALALTPNGCQLYVHDHANNQVDAITVSTDAVAAKPAVATTGDPTGMSVTPDSAHVYVANFASSSVSVIATATNTVSATLASTVVGASPTAVLATSSPYYYKLQATHGGWLSPLTAASGAYPLGFNQGGWQ
jgi:YVTN family beta-propeller protein